MSFWKTTRQARRKLRTAILGVVAFVALIWGAVDIVGVPAENLWALLGEIVIGVLLLITLAAVPAALMYWRKSKRREL